MSSQPIDLKPLTTIPTDTADVISNVSSDVATLEPCTPSDDGDVEVASPMTDDNMHLFDGGGNYIGEQTTQFTPITVEDM